MADAYKSLKLLDSSSCYNKVGYNHSKKINNEYLNTIFILNERANQTLKKIFHANKDSAFKTLLLIIKINDLLLTSTGISP